MRLLFVASRFPYPPLNGDQVRGYHHIRVLSRRHEIVLLAPSPAGDEAERADALQRLGELCCHVETVRTPAWRRLGRLPRAAVDARPLQTLLFHDGAVDEAAARLAARFDVDLVHGQLIRMAPVHAALPAAVPRVLDLIDSLALNMERRAARSRPPLSWVAQWESGRAARYEREMTAAWDELAISSPLDREYMGDPDNVHVVANGVDLDAHAFVDAEREPDTLVFSGTMWYFPNVDAAQWLVTQVLPLVRREIPGVRLAIVGARPARAVEALGQHPGVTVTGFVPSVHEHVARAAVAVAPMQSGSGIQFKIIEAMAAGTPVVATPVAVRGLAAVPERDLLVAAEPAAFAAALVALLRDPARRRRLAEAGRRLAEEHYGWEGTVAALERVYDRAADSAVARGGGRSRAPAAAGAPVVR